MTTKRVFEIVQNEMCPYFNMMELKMFLFDYELFSDFWNNCKRGDFMIFIACILGVDFASLSKTRGNIANIVRHLMRHEESIKAVDAAMSMPENENSNSGYLLKIIQDSINVSESGYIGDATIAYYFANIAATLSLQGSCYVIYMVAAASRYDFGHSFTECEIQNMAACICRKYLTNCVSKHF